ncbi:MAG: DapH/DapD/GlmU-related protein [Tissierellia bacterium]|nr:DapH/DapD/GlmU-related protein [Tissierellia bacterium]
MKKVFLFADKGQDYCFFTKIVNKPVIDYPILSSKEAGVAKLYLVSDHIDLERPDLLIIKEEDIKNHIEEDDDLIFFRANMPLVKAKSLKKLYDKLIDYDMVVEEDSSAAIYAIRGAAFLSVEEDEVKKSLAKLRSSLEKVKVINSKSGNKLFIVMDYEDLSKADSLLRKSINKEYMKKNIFIENPDSVTIEKGVKIGPGTRIESGVRILGKTQIGENCFIGFNSRIADSIIHDNVEVFTSFVEKSEIEDYTNIGPYARLRPNAHLKKKVHIGNFVEVKNSVVGEGTKAGHLAYIGDAELGKDINVSCGVIFANYDGKFKHKAVVEDGAFLGSNVNIVAPVKIEKDGFIAAGSTVTKDVKEGYLMVERAQRRDIEGYMARKRKRDKLKEVEMKEKNAKN